MNTYERVFAHVKKQNFNGHAYRNHLNRLAVKKANEEIKEMLKDGK